MRTEIFHVLPQQAVAIRREVFEQEQGFVDEFDETDARATHFLLYDSDSAPIATCRVFRKDGGEVWYLGRFAVRKPYRRRGCGAYLLSAAEEYVRAVGGREIRLSSQLHAKDFYTASGYEIRGEVEIEQDCPHVPMAKTL